MLLLSQCLGNGSGSALGEIYPLNLALMEGKRERAKDEGSSLGASLTTWTEFLDSAHSGWAEGLAFIGQERIGV